MFSLTRTCTQKETTRGDKNTSNNNEMADFISWLMNGKPKEDPAPKEEEEEDQEEEEEEEEVQKQEEEEQPSCFAPRSVTMKAPDSFLAEAKANREIVDYTVIESGFPTDARGHKNPLTVRVDLDENSTTQGENNPRAVFDYKADLGVWLTYFLDREQNMHAKPKQLYMLTEWPSTEDCKAFVHVERYNDDAPEGDCCSYVVLVNVISEKHFSSQEKTLFSNVEMFQRNEAEKVYRVARSLLYATLQHLMPVAIAARVKFDVMSRKSGAPLRLAHPTSAVWTNVITGEKYYAHSMTRNSPLRPDGMPIAPETNLAYFPVLISSDRFYWKQLVRFTPENKWITSDKMIIPEHMNPALQSKTVNGLWRKQTTEIELLYGKNPTQQDRVWLEDRPFEQVCRAPANSLHCIKLFGGFTAMLA